MIERICTHLLTLLAADPRLYAGGNAYAAGWPGYTRSDISGSVQEGYVNLFDKPYDEDGADHRPAVYVGTRSTEAVDSEDFPTQSATRTEYRILVVPLVICVQADTKNAARVQRNQLRNNIRRILFDNFLANGYWYELTMDGGRAGSSSGDDRVWTTATGGPQVAEAVAIVPIQIRYSWNSTASA